MAILDTHCTQVYTALVKNIGFSVGPSSLLATGPCPVYMSPSSVINCSQLLGLYWPMDLYGKLSPLCSPCWLYLYWLRASRKNTYVWDKKQKPPLLSGSSMAVGKGQGALTHSSCLPSWILFPLVPGGSAWPRGTEETLFLSVYPVFFAVPLSQLLHSLVDLTLFWLVGSMDFNSLELRRPSFVHFDWNSASERQVSPLPLLEHFLAWDSHSFSGQTVPVPHHS